MTDSGSDEMYYTPRNVIREKVEYSSLRENRRGEYQDEIQKIKICNFGQGVERSYPSVFRKERGY